MKKVLLLLLTIVTLGFAAAPASAQQTTLTVADSTAGSTYIPVYGSWLDNYIHSQIIYPESMLEALVGKTITSLKFYFKAPPTSPQNWTSVLNVSLGTVSQPTFSSTSFLTDQTDIVYTGTLSVNQDSTMTIDFDEPFVYTGGNLLLDFSSVTKGGFSGATFYGINSSGSSISGYNSASVSSISNTAQRNFIPKTTFTYSNSSITCFPPTAQTITGAPTANQATLSWSPREGQTEWEVYCGTGDIDLDDVVWIPVTNGDTSYTFDNLNANTIYTAYVRTVCGEGYSNPKYVNFRTACDLLTALPFTENFESVPSGSNQMPFCWSRGAASTSYPYSYAYSTAAHGGSRGLYFTTTANSAIMPEIDPSYITLSDAQLTFWAKTGTAGTVLQIGILDEDNTFDLICALPLTTAWKQYTIPFHLYEGTGTRVVLRNLTSTAIYVDDLSLEEVADCTMPVNVTCSPTENSATFNCLSTATSYNIYYKEATASEWDVEEDVTLPYTLTGLNSNTEYKYYIQTACGLETEFTTDSATFRTIIAATSLPYEATFDESDEWIIDNGTCTNRWMIGDIGSDVTGLFVTRDPVSQIKRYNISSASTVVAQKIIEVGTNASFSLDFDFKCGGESTWDYIKVFLAPTSSIYTSGATPTWATGVYNTTASYSTYAADFSEAIALLSQTTTPYKLNLTNGNTIHVSVIFNNPIPQAERDENSIAKLVFAWMNDGSGSTDSTGAIISNVEFKAISCARVSELIIPNSTIDATSATISWSQEDGASDFVVQYRATGEAWNEENMTQVSDTTITFEDLNPATPYQVRVATLCGSDTSVWRSGSFVTDCAPISMPYHCDFETVPAGSNQLPYCWYKRGASSTYPYSASNTNSHQGSRCLYFYNYYPNCIAVLPEINSQIDIRDLQLSFFYKTGSTNASTKLEVGVMTHPDSIASFTPLYTLSPTTSYSSSADVFPLTDAPEGKNYIAIRNVVNSSSATNYFYVDDLTLEYIPECMAPMYLDAYTQSSTADLSWMATGNSYNVYYKASTDEDFTEEPDVTLDENGVYPLGGLTASTVYQWYVVSVCDDGTELTSDTATFTTKCAPLTLSQLPQSWDFESGNTAGTTSYPLPTCWERITSTSTTSLYPYIISNSSHSHSGTKYLCFSNSYPNTFAILPQLDEDVDITNMQISFFGKLSSSSNAVLVVGVMDNYSDANSFTAIDTVVLQTTYSSDPEIVTFEGYEGTGTYIAFKNIVTSGTTSSAFHIDDVTLSTIPTCDNPTGVSVNPDSTFAYLAWENMFEGSYNVYLRSASAEEWGDPVLSNYTPEDTILLDNLSGGTTYQCLVATVCGNDEEASAFPVTFTTLCTSYPAPFSEDFDLAASLPNCWARYSGLLNSTSIAGSALTSTTSGWIFTNYYAFGHNHARVNIWSTSTKYWLVSPLINLSGLENPALTFDLALTDCNNADPIEDPTAQQDDRFIVLISTDNGATWSLDNATVWDNTGNGDYIYNAISTTGDQVQILLDDYAGQNIRIAFYAESTVSGGDNDLHIDNISVNEALSCLKPNGLFVSEIHNNRATVVWNQADESDSWLVEYDTAGFQPGTGIEVEVNGEPTLDLTALLATTTYDVYVKTVCADAATGYTEAVKVTFTTTCDPIDEIPYTWNFEANNTAGSSSYPLPACWTKYPATATYPYVNSTSSYAHAGTRCLYFYNYTSTYYAVLNEIDVENHPLNTLMLSFYAKASTSTSATIQVGVMTDPSNPTTFETIMTLSDIPTSYGSEPYQIPFNSYDGEGSFIAIRNTAGTSSYFYVDDMTLSELPDCITPINLQATNVTANSITLSWAADEDAQYELAYGAPGFNPDTVTPISASAPYTVEDLNEHTAYQFYVRTICSNGEPSDWSLPVSVTTPCTPVVVTNDTPFQEDFNTLTTGIPACWDNSEGTTTTASYRWNYYATGETGHCLRFNSYLNSSGLTNMLKTPTLDLSQVTVPQLSFSYKNPAGGDFSVFVSTDGGYSYSDTIATGLTGAANWTPVTYLLEDLTDNENVIIVFKGTSNCGYNDAYLYLDNVEVGNAPSCLKPTNLSATAVTTHTVTLSWNENNEDNNAWEIAYGTPGFNPDTVTPIQVSTNPFTVENLSSSTTYQFYVRALCSETDHSYWSLPTTQATECDVMPLPYTEDFEAYQGTTYSDNNGVIPTCWTNVSNNTTYGAPHVTSSGTYNYPHSGTNCLVFTCNSSGSDAYATLPNFNAPLNTLTLNFWYATESSTNGTLTVGYVTDITNVADSFITVATIPSTSNHTPVSDTVDFTGDNIPANGYICFHWHHNGAFYSCCIDDINVTSDGGTPVVTDPTVATNAAENVTANSATLKGTITNPDGVAIDAKGFQWKATQNGNYASVAAVVTDNAMSYELTNLAASTSYTYRAFIVLGNDTVFASTQEFTTSGTTPEPPTVPTVTTNDATYTQTTATLYASINNPSSVNITGKGFQWKVSGGNYQDVTGAGSGNNFSATLTDLTPNTQYFFQAYITTADTTVYGAERSFTTLPEEVEPCATPTGVTTSDITKESIKVSWDDVEGITWKVQYRPVNGTFTSAEALTNSYVMPGLNPETTYEIQVQANCGNDNVSAWTEIVTATTLADGVNNYLENSVVLYPNPAKEVINVQCTMNEWNGATIEVLDVYGKLLQTLKADSEITQINVSNLANGMYFVRMTTEQGVVTKRFVKK